MTTSHARKPDIPAFAWMVFALTFGLLISDYMARQVLNAVFPLLKAEWALSDTQLGLLSGIVAITVAVLTCPISLLADRVGRVKSITAMAVMWSIATLLCGLATSYGQMLVARLFVGLGEAAYGSVGIAVVISVFPARLRATLTGAFMSGGLAGQVLGVGVGGLVAAAEGWRTAFLAIGCGGLVLAIVYPLFVRERRLGKEDARTAAQFNFSKLGALFRGRTLKFTYLASGLQLFVAAAIPAWLPSYFVRYYGLPLEQAAPLAALFLAVGGAGMVVCGAISDLIVRSHAHRALLSVLYCGGCGLAITAALACGPGPAQLMLLGIGMFLAAASAGPAGAIVAGLTPEALHGTAFAVLTLANNIFGLAPGPVVTGWLADRIGLLGALQWLPVASAAAAAAFLFATGRESSLVQPAEAV